MSVFQAKVPAALASGVICLVLGGGLGALIMSYVQSKPEQAKAAPGEDGDKVGEPKGDNSKGDKGAKGQKGGPPGPGGPRGPSPKTQLAQLVGRLDTLTKQSLHVELTAEQKKQAQELLAGLEAKDAITDEEAKAKLDALLKLVEKDRPTLEAAGYRWPGAPAPGGMGGAQQQPPNPFKAGEGAERLKSLQATLGK